MQGVESFDCLILQFFLFVFLKEHLWVIFVLKESVIFVSYRYFSYLCILWREKKCNVMHTGTF